MTSFVAAVFVAVFALAALGKLDGWHEWRAAAAEFFPRFNLAPTVAVGLPVLELAASVAIVAAPREGLFLGAAILLVFAAGVLVLRRNHAGASCNCFGPALSTTIGYGLAARNVLLGAGAVALALAASPTVGFAQLLAAGIAATTASVALQLNRLRLAAREFDSVDVAGV